MVECMDPWFLGHLVCPVLKTPLVFTSSCLRAEDGYEYPVINGIPIMLRHNWDETLWVAGKSLAQARDLLRTGRLDNWSIDTVGISADELELLRKHISCSDDHPQIDPVVSYLVAATNGIGYKHLLGKLKRYPLPEIRLPMAQGEVMLDLGCNWGRWCIAASRKGYQVVGIDPSLGAVMAARRVAKQLGVNAHYLVGDARYLPFKNNTIDVVFSYSVLQHFSYENVGATLKQIKRILRSNGYCFVQMPNKFGLRCLQHQIKRLFQEPKYFDVRYWEIGQLKGTFSSLVGPVTLSVDGFFGLGIQTADLPFMPLFSKAVILLSYLLTRLSRFFKPMMYFADSVYVLARKISE